VTVRIYVLVGRDGREFGGPFDTYRGAVQAAEENGYGNLAVVEREYTEYNEDLVWTPDGSKTWPSPGQGETQCSE